LGLKTTMVRDALNVIACKNPVNTARTAG